MRSVPRSTSCSSTTRWPSARRSGGCSAGARARHRVLVNRPLAQGALFAQARGRRCRRGRRTSTGVNGRSSSSSGSWRTRRDLRDSATRGCRTSRTTLQAGVGRLPTRRRASASPRCSDRPLPAAISFSRFLSVVMRSFICSDSRGSTATAAWTPAGRPASSRARVAVHASLLQSVLALFRRLHAFRLPHSQRAIQLIGQDRWKSASTEATFG